MMSEATRLSANLLRAERAMQSGSADREQESRWIELMAQWTELARSTDERRRFLRYGCDMEIRLRNQDGERRTFRLTEISNFGMQVKGNLGSWLRSNDCVVWEAIYSDGHWQRINAPCMVERKPSRWSAALSWSGSTLRARRRIHRTAYYPAYMQYLQRLAAAPANA